MTISSNQRDLLRLSHMIKAIEGLRSVVLMKSAQEIEADWASARAVERGFEIISEASRHLSDDLKAREPDIPWRAIAGIGNVFRHDYDGIEMSVLLQTFHKDLDTLEVALRRQHAGISQA